MRVARLLPALFLLLVSTTSCVDAEPLFCQEPVGLVDVVYVERPGGTCGPLPPRTIAWTYEDRLLRLGEPDGLVRETWVTIRTRPDENCSVWDYEDVGWYPAGYVKPDAIPEGGGEPPIRRRLQYEAIEARDDGTLARGERLLSFEGDRTCLSRYDVTYRPR